MRLNKVSLLTTFTFFISTLSAWSATSKAPLFLLKNSLKTGDAFVVAHRDRKTETISSVTFEGSKNLEVRVHANEQGKIEAVELRDNDARSPQTYVLARGQNASRPYSECLHGRGDRDYLCVTVTDLPTVADRESRMTIAVLPSWVMYARPKFYAYTLRWNSHLVPVSVEVAKTKPSDRTQIVQAVKLSINTGVFFGISGLKNEVQSASKSRQ